MSLFGLAVGEIKPYVAIPPIAGSNINIAHASPDAIAHAFGVRLQREFGSDWARLIGIAAAAAMAADHRDGGE